jgi:hypothetical protein
MDLVSAGERASLLTRLEQVRQNILRAVERNTTVGPDRQTQVLVLGTANFREAREVTIGGATMTEYNVQIGDNATFHGNFTVANSIQDSFNTLKQSSLPANVHSTVETLIKQVAEMSARLPADAAKQTADDLNAFVKEASSQQPRRKWYELSAEGLLDAAKAVGEVGKPVIIMGKPPALPVDSQSLTDPEI